MEPRDCQFSVVFCSCELLVLITLKQHQLLREAPLYGLVLSPTSELSPQLSSLGVRAKCTGTPTVGGALQVKTLQLPRYGTRHNPHITGDRWTHGKLENRGEEEGNYVGMQWSWAQEITFASLVEF